MDKDITITQDLKLFQQIVKMALQGNEDKVNIVNIGPINFNNIQSDNREVTMPTGDHYETKGTYGELPCKSTYTIEECMTKIMEVMPDPIADNIECLIACIAVKKFGNAKSAGEALGKSYDWTIVRNRRFNEIIMNMEVKL